MTIQEVAEALSFNRHKQFRREAWFPTIHPITGDASFNPRLRWAHSDAPYIPTIESLVANDWVEVQP